MSENAAAAISGSIRVPSCRDWTGALLESAVLSARARARVRRRLTSSQAADNRTTAMSKPSVDRFTYSCPFPGCRSAQISVGHSAQATEQSAPSMAREQT